MMALFRRHWPPLLSEKRDNKKAARKCVEELHGQSFPMRVKQEDKDKFLYLLNVREIAPDDTRTQEYFDDKKCPQCDSTFKLIDIYNDGLRTPGGRDFCSHTCLAAYRERERTFDPTKQDDELGRHAAFIYRIYNLIENKSYIGQTKQVSHFVGINILSAQGRFILLSQQSNHGLVPHCRTR